MTRDLVSNFLVLVSLCASPTLGQPSWFWIRTYHPGAGFADPGIPWGPQFMPNTTSLVFMNYLANGVIRKFPSVGVSTQEVRDYQFTPSQFVQAASSPSGPSSAYEMQFIYSHGSPDGVMTYSGMVGVRNDKPNQIALTGYNRYLVLFACRALHERKPGSYSGSFKGGHAILGSRSDLKAFGFQSTGSSQDDLAFYVNEGERSNRLGEIFSDYFLNGGLSIWDSWRMALELTQSRWTGTGAEPAIVYALGKDPNGNIFIGDMEKFATMYNAGTLIGGTPSQSSSHAVLLSAIPPSTIPLGYTSATYGTPTYDNSTIPR